MEDKITFANVVTLFMHNTVLGKSVADELGSTDLGDVLSNYRMGKSLRSLQAAYREYSEQRNKIIEAIGEEDEQGNKNETLSQAYLMEVMKRSVSQSFLQSE